MDHLSSDTDLIHAEQQESQIVNLGNEADLSVSDGTEVHLGESSGSLMAYTTHLLEVLRVSETRPDVQKISNNVLLFPYTKKVKELEQQFDRLSEQDPENKLLESSLMRRKLEDLVSHVTFLLNLNIPSADGKVNDLLNRLKTIENEFDSLCDLSKFIENLPASLKLIEKTWPTLTILDWTPEILEKQFYADLKDHAHERKLTSSFDYLGAKVNVDLESFYQNQKWAGIHDSHSISAIIRSITDGQIFLSPDLFSVDSLPLSVRLQSSEVYRNAYDLIFILDRLCSGKTTYSKLLTTITGEKIDLLEAFLPSINNKELPFKELAILLHNSLEKIKFLNLLSVKVLHDFHLIGYIVPVEDQRYLRLGLNNTREVIQTAKLQTVKDLENYYKDKYLFIYRADCLLATMYGQPPEKNLFLKETWPGLPSSVRTVDEVILWWKENALHSTGGSLFPPIMRERMRNKVQQVYDMGEVASAEQLFLLQELRKNECLILRFNPRGHTHFEQCFQNLINEPLYSTFTDEEKSRLFAELLEHWWNYK